MPRQIGKEALAKKFDISRRTFEEHLRKAEKKLVENFGPTLLIHIS
ncbi:MAG: helix-turn-helix domain-containing protein [Candidatus Odinarchaeota archaeon]